MLTGAGSAYPKCGARASNLRDSLTHNLVGDTIRREQLSTMTIQATAR